MGKFKAGNGMSTAYQKVILTSQLRIPKSKNPAGMNFGLNHVSTNA